MADKTWTATDLELGKLSLLRRGDEIHIERRYKFLDSGGVVLEQIAGGRYVDDIAISSLPSEVASALQTIDTWTKNQALAQEGMGE